MYKNECIYIAGPECFYTGGFDQLNVMRRRAEGFGFSVSLPNDTPLFLENEDLRKNGDTIFDNCAKSMLRSTAIIADLETFRGAEPDGGTIYEIGMAYALGLRCYCYTRDLRAMVHKYPGAKLDNGLVLDLDGRVLPYQELPFSPSVVGACKIIEGDFDDCLRMLMRDIDEEHKHRAKRETPAVNLAANVTRTAGEKPLVYLSCAARYDLDADAQYAKMKELCATHGFDAVCPLDDAPGVSRVETDNPYTRAYNTFDRWQQHVRNCDIFIGDLNDFHGFEPNSDTSFEAGMAWQLGKACFGYMADTTIMRERIPHYGEDKNNKDIYGNDVENFNYPINLMFASSMPVLQGGLADVIGEISHMYNKK